MTFGTEVLNDAINPGLFIGQGGITYWVIENGAGKFAVHLDERGSNPVYSSTALTRHGIVRGSYQGPVRLRLFMAAPQELAGRYGVIIVCGSQIHLTVRDGAVVKTVPLNRATKQNIIAPEYHPAWALEPFGSPLRIHSYLNPYASAILDAKVRGNAAAAAALADSRVFDVGAR